jgi:nicotinamidase-related amidase
VSRKNIIDSHQQRLIMEQDMPALTLNAEPYPLEIELAHVSLLLIDMQNDFCSPGGWADLAGLDISHTASVIPAIKPVLLAARETGLLIIHTREGHRPDLSDCPENKQRKMRRTGFEYGQQGPRGRFYIRGSWNNEIVDDLQPLPGEVVIDKPGKGAFYATDLELILHNRAISTLIVCGVTTHVCVSSTLREAADRGFDGVLLSDCCQSYEEGLHQGALEVLRMPGALFGWLAHSEDLIALLEEKRLS